MGQTAVPRYQIAVQNSRSQLSHYHSFPFRVAYVSELSIPAFPFSLFIISLFLAYELPSRMTSRVCLLLVFLPASAMGTHHL
ncbi:hypothetical protein P280DRAFT_430495 [Massarina eburnea CBS 473.64]|uniref:Uncharacterized protein n=1 Tax=Massarina eburnea CBS 473.64 TaxID=1395130 RepID=A0A6A6RUS5_9PLEO|nr:hypothetical protein P280DRAFT_430495 [Massarina eburnea CBS 473.64]